MELDERLEQIQIMLEANIAKMSKIEELIKSDREQSIKVLTDSNSKLIELLSRYSNQK